MSAVSHYRSDEADRRQHAALSRRADESQKLIEQLTRIKGMREREHQQVCSELARLLVRETDTLARVSELLTQESAHERIQRDLQAALAEAQMQLAGAKESLKEFEQGLQQREAEAAEQARRSAEIIAEMNRPQREAEALAKEECERREAAAARERERRAETARQQEAQQLALISSMNWRELLHAVTGNPAPAVVGVFTRNDPHGAGWRHLEDWRAAHRGWEPVRKRAFELLFDVAQQCRRTGRAADSLRQ